MLINESPFIAVLQNGWRIVSSESVKESGESISTLSFNAENWYPAKVPTTVMAALVENNVYKDIYFGKNLENIPTEQFKCSWWYRKEFKHESKFADENVRLIFEGINYRANVWLNGHQIVSSDTLAGSFRIFEVDITEYVQSGNNVLAVEVFPPKPGDFTIGFVDWNPKPPDENMGIWREVKLRTSSTVSIKNPFVQTKVNLETLDEASLSITSNLVNHCDKEVSGIFKVMINDIEFEQSFTLKSFEEKEIFFLPEYYKQLIIHHPRLWWPNNLGDPNLYPLELTVLIQDEVSDTQSIRFGIREVSDYINENGHRGYKINGKKVLIRGGGWVDDLLLADSPKKVEDQVRYAKYMNLNTIRLEGFWGSSQLLYDLADQYGMLLMVGWSCQWEWENYLGKPVDEFGGIKTPEDMELITQSLQDQVLWLRNHPGIFAWVLGSDFLPRPELEKKYDSCLDAIDRTRPALKSCKLLESEISGSTAVKMNGPYDYVTPNYWYVDKKKGGAFGFNTETGPGPQPPPLESIKKIIPKDHLWPIDDFWNYHCGRNEFNTLEIYTNALDHRYGKSKTVEEYTQKSQLANYEAMRAMFEAFGVNKHNATGVVQWMLNSAWPEMYWQLYDYYLMPNGAFYGTKTGCQPIHIVYHYGDKNIYIINDTLLPLENLKAEICIFNIDSKIIFKKQLQVSISENASKKILELPDIDGMDPVYFLDLRLLNSDNENQSRNFYWLSAKEDILDDDKASWIATPNKEFADFTPLNHLPKVTLDINARFINKGQDQEVRVSLRNPGETIAFFIELDVFDEINGDSVLPVFWDENYISLLPGDIQYIRGRFSGNDLKSGKPAFRISGWNVENNG